MKKIISVILTCCVLFCASVFSGCNAEKEDFSDNSGKVSIVSTIFPYFDFAKNITGGKADVRVLLSPGNEPHSYDPAPADIVAIESCDIFIYNGGESDEWVESVLDSLQNTDIVILRMIDYVEPLYEQTPDHKTGDEYDEHIWTSLRNAQKLSSAIAGAVASVDKANADYYAENAEKYNARLKKLDGRISEIAENAVRNTVVFGDRFPFLYFLTDYNLDYECAFPGCSSETEPSITTVTHLIDYVEREKIPAVFYIEFSNGKTAKLIAEDTGAEMYQIFSCHNVTKEQFENGEDYISLMEHNADVLKEALS